MQEFSDLGKDYTGDSWSQIEAMESLTAKSCLTDSGKSQVHRAGSSCSHLLLVLDVMLRASRAEPSSPGWPVTIFPIESWECGTPLSVVDDRVPTGLANSCTYEGRIFTCVLEEDLSHERGCLKDTAGRMLAASSCRGASVLCGDMAVSTLVLAANMAYIKGHPAPLDQSLAHLRAVRLPRPSPRPPQTSSPSSQVRAPD